MPTFQSRFLGPPVPKYRKHKPSGQAVATFNGQDCYLGPWGTKTSRLEYDRLVSEWLQNGRRLPKSNTFSTTVRENAWAIEPPTKFSPHAYRLRLTLDSGRERTEGTAAQRVSLAEPPSHAQPACCPGFP